MGTKILRPGKDLMLPGVELELSMDSSTVASQTRSELSSTLPSEQSCDSSRSVSSESSGAVPSATSSEPSYVMPTEVASEPSSEPPTEVASASASPTPPRKPLVVGSDCSGMGTECYALEALGIEYVHAFCSEIWEPAIRCLRSKRQRAKRMYRDVTKRELDEEVPSVDLYVCGFPCQPNSALNLKRGGEDARRDPMVCALAYIEAKRPRYFVLENVVGLTTVCKGALWNALVDRLDALEGYAWDYRVLDPCKHANSPQSRPRVYLCGARGTDRPIEWPDEVPLTTRCVDLLDKDAFAQPAAPCYLKMLETWGIEPSQEGIVEFCAASRTYSPYKDPRPLQPHEVKHVLRADVAPCLIRHDPGPYANHLQRHLTADECLKLQGFDPALVRKPQVTPLQMRQLCGNAMHCGVLARVLEKLLLL